jgi:hypothetical protein
MKHALALGLALTLTACGTAPTAPAHAPRVASGLAARSDAGMHDGVVALRKLRFKKLDLNESGDLTRAEASDQALLLPGFVNGFDDYDADHDGRITLTEFLREDVIQWWLSDLRPQIAGYFRQMDTNRDGALTAKERDRLTLFLSQHPELHGGDLNQDGKVDASEFEDAYMVVLPDYQPAPERSSRLPSPIEHW